MKKKRYITLKSLILLGFLLSNFTTSEKLDFTTEVVQISNERIDIIVTITSGEPDYIYSLWNKEPWENGTEIESSRETNQEEYIFRNLRKKAYFVVVTDKKGLKRVKQIQL